MRKLQLIGWMLTGILVMRAFVLASRTTRWLWARSDAVRARVSALQ